MKDLFIFVLALALLVGCSTEPETNPEDYAFHNMSFNEEIESEDFSIIGVHENGSYVAIDGNNSKPERIVYKNSSNSDGLYIWVNSDGYPYQAFVNGNFVLFDNFDPINETLDIAIIRSNGEIEILRNIEIGFPEIDRSMADVLRWSGHALSLAGCGISIAGTISSGGLLAPVAILGCGAAITGVLVEIIPEDNPEIEASNAALSAYASAVGCIGGGNVIQCISWIVNSAGAVATVAENAEIENQDEIQSAQGILIGGYGDIQITLTWDNTSDLDLYVTDPLGETICYYNPTSASGGWLDFDDTNGYGPENVFWENNSAPQGDYFVELDYYSGSSSSNYIIVVSIGSNNETYSGSIDINETIEICSFNYSGNRNIVFNYLDIHKKSSSKPNKGK